MSIPGCPSKQEVFTDLMAVQASTLQSPIIFFVFKKYRYWFNFLRGQLFHTRKPLSDKYGKVNFTDVKKLSLKHILLPKYINGQTVTWQLFYLKTTTNT